MASKPKGADTIERVARQLEALVVEWAEPGSLKPNPWNPNRQNAHEFKMLQRSISDAGFTQPIMVVKIRAEQADEWEAELQSGHYVIGDTVIVDGEHRWKAAAALGLTSIPVVVMPYGGVQARLSTLQMNRARGSEDLNLATAVLRDLDRLGMIDWAAESLDMSFDEVDRLLTDIAPPEALTWDDKPGAPPLPNDTDSLTPAALRRHREIERRIAQAKSTEEREAIEADRRTYRMVLTFAGDEADVVKTALGDAPAVRVLEWCRNPPGGSNAQF